MKKIFCFMTMIMVFALFSVSGISAQSLKGMSLNGTTGLYSIPTGRIGWERSSDFGLDLGYHAVIKEGTSNIPALAVSLFKWVELSGAFDIQPGENESDIITGLKIQFPVTNTAIAIGGNFQALNLGNDRRERKYVAGQIYAAVTYTGKFFNMPAETTVVLGKTIIEDHPANDTNIDFGMGFDLILLPSVFQNYIHWITDFANFSYSVESYGVDSWIRGVLNTGVRVDLAMIPAFEKFKFAVDLMLTDAFDRDRAFSIGLVFGVPVL